ncbi:ribosomal RNA-processing protein 7 homolog A-like [Littorina saxatilis]|uniref:RRM domain-containing protein n=1 Tax=Littorina saxatilis TaxID=31220 RepID=A0AAN9BYQ4_9CAEN
MAESEHMVIKGLTVVPVKFDEARTTVHYVYLKQHDVRQKGGDDVKPKDRTVFVGNVPPWATEESFKHAFGCCGRVENVYFHAKPCKGKPAEDNSKRRELFPKMDHRVAYLVFKNQQSVNKALHLSYTKSLTLSTKKSPIVHGCARYKQMYLESRQTDVAELKKQVTERIMEHDLKEQEIEEVLKNAEPDDEGWTVVTRVGKNKGAPRTEAEDRRVKQKEGRKRKRKEMTNFYTFQTREQKKQKIEELREKFEMDRSKVEIMKAQRKFKPF